MSLTTLAAGISIRSGFEGLLPITAPLEASDPAVTESPAVHLFLDGLGLAPTAMGVKAERGDDGVATVEQLVNGVSGRGKQLVGAPQGPRDLGRSTANPGLDCVRGIDV